MVTIVGKNGCTCLRTILFYNICLAFVTDQKQLKLEIISQFQKRLDLQKGEIVLQYSE